MPRLDDEQITAGLCKAFRETYEAANVTQGQVAEALEVDQPAVSRWARGERRPPLWALPEVEKICRVPRGHILRMAGFVDDELDLRAAIRADRSISADQQGALLAVYDIFRTKTALAERGPVLSPEERKAAEESAERGIAKHKAKRQRQREQARQGREEREREGNNTNT